MKFDRKSTAYFIAGFIWGAVVLFIACIIFLRSNFILEYPSRLNFDETVKAISSVKDPKMMWVLRQVKCVVPETSKGCRIQVFQLCNLEYASALMEDEKSRKVASVIPCTLAVYEKADKSVWVARLNVSLMGYILGGTAEQIFPYKVAPEQQAMFTGIFL